MSKKEETVDDFAGWDSSGDVDFFGEAPIEEVKEETSELEGDKPETITEDIVEKTTEEKTEEVEEDVFNFDEEVVEDPAKPKEKKETIKKEAGSTNNTSTLNFLKEKGFLDYKLEEGQELTEELAEELIESTLEESVETRIKELTDDLPSVVKDMVKYAKSGGDVESLIAKMASQSVGGINKDTDITDETNQVLVLKKDLQAQGYDDDYIESNIEFIKNQGKLEGVATKLFEKEIKKQESFATAQAVKQEEQRKIQKGKQKDYKKDLSTYLQEKKEIRALKFTPKEKKDLPGYISDPSIKMDNGTTVSPLQKDLMEALKDKDKTLMLAKILKSDFDFSSISKAAQTKLTEEVKNDLQRTKDLTKKTKGNLADYFD